MAGPGPGPGPGEESLQALYRWVDAIPLSRPKRNMARDFSDAGPRPPPASSSSAPSVLAAEVVKFYFPKLVDLHSYVPASATQQKLSNWGHLNRKVLSKLNFCIPDDMIRKIVQCRPGLVEQVLILLRQKIEEKQKQSKVTSGLDQELGVRAALEQISYLETGYSSKVKSPAGGDCARESLGADRLKKSHHGYAQTSPGDSTFRLQLAEREQALLLAQETIQILQMKVRRLEQLVHLKNIRIDDLSQRLQEAEHKQK
ncbi:sperm flagellar protein 1 isoform X2 [Struthio camelus]|uniref:sperm flagellar protein 1 isoform X2 n=1 Tax=Struthio camelus TaxID=8801 RepID=UPI003603F115